MENGNRSGVRSVGRALTILELLSLEERGLGIAEISRRIELPISTCHRLLTTLTSHGFVAQDDETGSYSVGLRAFEVGNAFSYQTSLGKEALPYMSILLAAVNETANLRVLDGNSAVLIQQVKSDHLLSMDSRSGTRIPLYCSAVGKVLLAGLSNERIESFLKLQTLK
ncbi:MAG: IclR family transcriptional regulator, partial [Thermomicrobiales bacterium]|nr:IclR family transcriptional regulator [Thermomicrobiales bacterium]